MQLKVLYNKIRTDSRVEEHEHTKTYRIHAKQRHETYKIH